MRYLITGVEGFIGRYLTAHILDVDKDAEVVGLGRSARDKADERFRYERLSLLDTVVLRELIAELRPDCIFHLASALHEASELAAETGRSETSIAHSEYFVLVDGQGGIRGYYDANDSFRLEKLAQDAQSLRRRLSQDGRVRAVSR